MSIYIMYLEAQRLVPFAGRALCIFWISHFVAVLKSFESAVILLRLLSL
jgi:hypothetical protein